LRSFLKACRRLVLWQIFAFSTRRRSYSVGITCCMCRAHKLCVIIGARAPSIPNVPSTLVSFHWMDISYRSIRQKWSRPSMPHCIITAHEIRRKSEIRAIIALNHSWHAAQERSLFNVSLYASIIKLPLSNINFRYCRDSARIQGKNDFAEII